MRRRVAVGRVIPTPIRYQHKVRLVIAFVLASHLLSMTLPDLNILFYVLFVFCFAFYVVCCRRNGTNVGAAVADGVRFACRFTEFSQQICGRHRTESRTTTVAITAACGTRGCWCDGSHTI